MISDRNKFLLFIAVLVLFTESAIAQTEGSVFLLDPSMLTKAREGIASRNRVYLPAFTRLKKEANKLLNVTPPSVTTKDQTPPSGDKHDYLSLAPYHWPNPDTPNGLPYIRRDGEVNPEARKLQDHAHMTEMANSVRKLALAFYFTDDENYAKKATSFLRVWFLNPETRMNPNLNYAQAIKGVNEGRGAGLIEARWYADVVDAIGILNASKAWTADDQAGMKKWFGKYLDWLQSSPVAKHESNALNNHGVWFDVQFTSIALFLGKRDLAITTLNEAKTKRISTQIEPDGRMPKELARTKALGYTTFNLDAFMHLAALGKTVGLDLWGYRTEDGRSIRKALDWALPYMLGKKEWEYKQILPYSMDDAYVVLKQAAAHYGDSKYKEACADIENDKRRSDNVNLLYVN